MIFALFQNGWTIENVLILIVLVAAGVALVYVALKKFGIAVPDWVVQVFWIVAVAFVIVMAIRFVFTL